MTTRTTYTYAHFDEQRAAILLDIAGSEPIQDLEARYDYGRVGRITEWFSKIYGASPTTFRRKAAAGTTALVFGSFYFLDASRDARYRLANALCRDGARSKAEQEGLPYGDYQIWVVDGYTCVMSTDTYQTTGKIYRKLHKFKLNLNHPTLLGEMACLHSTDTRGVPLPDSTVAYMFNLLWFPDPE